MIKLYSRRGKSRTLRRGQGLVEYSLILVLVAVTVILITAVLGEDIRQVYCDIVYELDSDINAPLCDAPDDVADDADDEEDDDGDVTVTCHPSGGTVSNTTEVRASASGDNPIARVEFTLSGPESTTRIEYIDKYCAFGGGDGGSACSSPPGGTLNSGTYTLNAEAFDDEENSSSCSSTFTVP